MQKSLAAAHHPSGGLGSTRSVASVSLEREARDQAHSDLAPDSPSCSHSSRCSVLTEDDYDDSGLSEDDNLHPDQPAFTGLFPQSLFKSLLFKAVNTARLSSPHADPAPASSSSVSVSLDLMFAEPSRPVASIPTPPLFLDVVKRQWSSPGSAPLPSSNDRRNFQVAKDLDSLLRLPSVDPPVAALLPNAGVPGTRRKAFNLKNGDRIWFFRELT